MYAKVFRQIFESSIAENPTVRFTFMDLLVLADINGVVDMTHESIARITNRPLDEIRSTIAILESPDPRSRTPDEGGARIRLLDDHRDWGWIIINYDRFRMIASEEQRREKTRERVTRLRSKRKEESKLNVTLCNASNAMQRQMQKQRQPQKEEDGRNLVIQLRAEVGKHFNRPTDAHWSYEEEFTVAELARRIDVLKEWDEIRAFRKTDYKFHRTSVLNLLQNWTTELDRSRICPAKKAKGPNL